jgi:hypothetical protein
MFKKSIFALCLLALATMAAPAPAEVQSQAISKSLTECTVIFQVYGLMAKKQNKPEEMIGYFNTAAARFRDAALETAEKEGTADPKQYVADTYSALLPKWQQKYAAITGEDVTVMAKETKDIMEWVNYCGALGRKINILPLPKE